MNNVKVSYGGVILDGMLSETHHQSNNAITTRTTLLVKKTHKSVEIFMGWPQSEGVYLEHPPYGSGDYFLVDETPTEYIFENR